jgi:isoleucyl-tRNA synthetase
VRQFVDAMTNWYIRRSRERFWDTGSGDSAATHAAFDTLYTTLEVLTRVSAPLLPLVTEEIWRGLTGGRSVHLADWPDASQLPADDDLVTAMDAVRAVCSTGSSLRKAEKLRVRLPLPELTVVTAAPDGLAPFAGIIADELNVKAVTVLDVADAHGSDFGISQRLVVNARAAGPRLGRDVQTAIKGSKTGDWSVAEDGTVTSGGLALVEGEYVVETVVDAEQAGSHATAMLPGGGFVVLDTDVTTELELEGTARDLVRAVQQARRDAGLEVSDRISLEVTGAEFVYRAVLNHRDLLTGETLTEHLSVTPDLDALDRDAADVTEVTVGERFPARLRIAVR